jgi:hypothetical protein
VEVGGVESADCSCYYDDDASDLCERLDPVPLEVRHTPAMAAWIRQRLAERRKPKTE